MALISNILSPNTTAASTKKLIQTVNEKGKVFVPRTVAPQADEKWWKIGENGCIPRYNGTVLPNCFTGNTKFITSKGVITLKHGFDLCRKGETFDVPTIDGDWHTARVRSHGIQRLYKVKLEGSTYICTGNHRWFIRTRRGNRVVTTTNLKPGMKIPYRMCNTRNFTRVLEIENTGRSERVYCVFEPVTHSFTLEGGEITGNCVGYAYGRFCEILGYFHPELPKCDAGRWIDVLKSTATSLTWGLTPKLGAVAVWKNPGKAGHVAVVEYMYDDGTIMLSESGYSASWNTRFWNSGPRSGPNWYGGIFEFQGFIYNPGTENVTHVVPYSGGVAHGQAITSTEHYNGTWDGSTTLSAVYADSGFSAQSGTFVSASSSVSVDHPARKYVRAALKHVGDKDSLQWVKDRTQVMAKGWSAAMCCAAGVDAELTDVIPSKDSSCHAFGSDIVKNYNGKYFVGPTQGGTEKPQVGDIFALYLGKSKPSSDYTATRLGIVAEPQDTTILTVEGDLQNTVMLQKRRIQDIWWFIRPDWTKVGGTEICQSMMASPLYDNRSTSEDATLREVSYLEDTCEPSINLTDVKLSAINYTTLLSGIYDAAGLSNMAVSSSTYSTTSGIDANDYNVDGSGIQPPNARIIFDFFISKGLSASQSVGFLANIRQESEFSTDAVNSYSGASGICQWLGGRKTSMIQFCGSDWKHNLTGQMDFLWSELNGDESRTLTLLKSQVTGNDEAAAIQASEIVLKNFERPGNYDEEVPRRAKFAREFWSMVLVMQSSTGTFTFAGTSNNIVTRSGKPVVVGDTKEIPASLRQWTISAKSVDYNQESNNYTNSSNQASIFNIWKDQGKSSKYYIATINGYFLINVMSSYGEVGDVVSVVLDDGTYFNAIISDTLDTYTVFESLSSGSADVLVWSSVGDASLSLSTGLKESGWLGKKVVKIVNYGSWING